MKNTNDKGPWWREGVIVFVKVSSYIVGPIITASYIGKFLDKRNNTNNLFFYISIAVAFILTISLIWREMRVYKNKLEKEENQIK